MTPTNFRTPTVHEQMEAKRQKLLLSLVHTYFASGAAAGVHAPTSTTWLTTSVVRLTTQHTPALHHIHGPTFSLISRVNLYPFTLRVLLNYEMRYFYLLKQ